MAQTDEEARRSMSYSVRCSYSDPHVFARRQGPYVWVAYDSYWGYLDSIFAVSLVVSGRG